VYAIAKRLAKPCIKIAPVSTSWAIAVTNPFESYFKESRNCFISFVSGETSDGFVRRPASPSDDAFARGVRILLVFVSTKLVIILLEEERIPEDDTNDDAAIIVFAIGTICI